MLRWQLVDDGARRLRLLWVGGWAALWSVGVVAASFGAVVAALAVRSQSTFTSDDVAEVVAARSWARDGKSTYYAGANNYGLRFPLVDLVESIWPTGKVQLLGLTAILVALTAILLVAAAGWSARTGLTALVAFAAVAWVLTNPGVEDAMARPTVRNVELGATALWLVGLDAAAGWRSRWRWAALPPTAVGIALLLWNDPYFTLVVALPLLAATLLGAALARSAWRAMLAGTIAAGVVGSRILDAVDFLSIDALRVPFRYPKPEEQELAEHLLYKQLPFAMGTNAEITGLPQAQADANRMVLVLLCVCGALAVVACIRRWRELPAGALTAASLIVVPTLAWYASSNMLTDGRSWRYIVMTPFALPVLLVPAARSLPAGLLRTGFLLVAGGLLVHSTWINTEAAVDTARCGLAERCVPLSTSNAERQDAAFAAWLENNAARKVLVSYFHGNMTAYLTDERVQAVTATCVDRRLHTWRWLTTESRVVAPTDRSEIVLEGGNVVGCRAADITKQIGPPREVRYFSDYQLWIYDGDITTRLPTKYA